MIDKSWEMFLHNLTVHVLPEKKPTVYEQRHRVVNDIEEKFCSKCDGWYTLDKFCKDVKNPDGRFVDCKVCSRQSNRDRREKAREATKALRELTDTTLEAV